MVYPLLCSDHTILGPGTHSTGEQALSSSAPPLSSAHLLLGQSEESLHRVAKTMAQGLKPGICVVSSLTYAAIQLLPGSFPHEIPSSPLSASSVHTGQCVLPIVSLLGQNVNKCSIHVDQSSIMSLYTQSRVSGPTSETNTLSCL